MKYRLIHWLDKLGLLNEMDYAAPDSPNERPHAYEARQTYRPARDNERAHDIPVGECCARCTGGKRHQVHRPPFQLDHTRGTQIGYAGGPHSFVRRDDGYCQECGAGRFYALHTRESLTDWDDTRLVSLGWKPNGLGNSWMHFRYPNTHWTTNAAIARERYLEEHGEEPLAVDYDDVWKRLQAERGTFPDLIYNRPVYTDGRGNFSPYPTLTCTELAQKPGA